MINWITPFFSPFCSDNASTLPAKLFGLFVRGMLLAKSAVLVHFDAVGRVLFVFVCPVVAIFANGAGKSNIRPHAQASCILIE